jgi:flagellar motor switch protein FliN
MSEFLNEQEKDVIGEIGNISFGTASTALSMMLNRDVDITTPHVTTISKELLFKRFPKPFFLVSVEYTEGLSGKNILMLKQEDAFKIADVLMGGDGSSTGELTDFHISAIQEVMNQMMGMTATSMSDLFNKKVDISPPHTSLLTVSKLTEDPDYDQDFLVKVSFHLTVKGLIESEIMQILTPEFAKKIANGLF